MIHRNLVFAILIVCFVALIPSAFAQEKIGALEVFIKNENHDRVAPEGLSIKIFKDSEKSPFQEIVSLENNPFTLSSLPQGHDYRIEVYANSMFAEVGFVNLQKSQERLDLSIKNQGGLRLSVFYVDGETPLKNAKVWIKSHDGKSWSSSETDENGQTIRTWLYPSTKDGNYYYAEISLGPNLKYVYSPIKLSPNAQELKVVTKWPTIVDNLITVEVYNSTKNKVTKQDGTFVAQLYDVKKTKIAESIVTEKGVAHFSNLKVNNYALYIKAKGVNNDLDTVAGKRVTITDTTGTIKIYLNNQELNSENLNCNCVAFRLDDIQDFFLAPAQIAVISLFEEKNVPLTIGVIGSVIGADQKLISTVKSGLAADNPIEIASHSWNNKILPSLSKNDQEDLIQKTNDKITLVFGLQPVTLIPPENFFNNDTLNVIKDNGFTHISYSTAVAEPPLFKKSDFYHFAIVPTTARLDAPAGVWRQLTNDQILGDVEQSLFDYGYAVVMMHPYEFSVYENESYTNKVNATKIQELASLIDKIQSENRQILPIRSIQDYDILSIIKPQVNKSETQINKSETPNCNCVAFRMDNIQDFWLNDVQNTVIDTFEKNDLPLTISIIGKFIGDDPKATGHIKEKLQNKSMQLRLANRGWEYVDHTAFDVQRQIASIKQTNDKIAKVFGTKAAIFTPPYDAFNKDTLEAAKQTKMLYLSASTTTDLPPFAADSLRHVPSTVSFVNLVDEDPFLSGTIQQKALAKVQASIKKYGFAVVSLQASDFAVKTDAFKNEINADNLSALESLIRDVKSSGTNVVMLESIPSILEEQSIVIPDWIKSNAGWWAEEKITDSDFTKGLEYLIEQQIVMVPPTPEGATSGQKIPEWIKTNAKWWSEDKISNSDFVKGIQYLIQNGVIRI